mgnify:CR=1 FL=1
MKTKLKLVKNTDVDAHYFSELPETTQELVKELILDAASVRGGPDGWKLDVEAIEDIECHARDGFIPFSHNRGGIQYRNFTDLMGYFGGGYSCTHKGASKEIERQIEYSLNLAAENTYSKFEALFKKIKLSKKKVSYSEIEERARNTKKYKEELREASSYIQDQEYESLGGESTIMHEFRFLYHGQENGIHSASVSASINTEGPYHRSSISWAPNVFCEGAKEIEITWKSDAELKRKLKKALFDASNAIF